MNLLKRLIVGLLGALLVLALLLGVYQYTATITVLDPAWVEERLSNAGVYELIVAEVVDAMDDQFEGQDGGWQTDAFAEVLEEVDLEGWLQEQVEAALDEVFPYMKSEQEGIEVSIDLRTFKDSLKENLEETLQAEFEQLPVQVPEDQYQAALQQAYEELDGLIEDEIVITPSQEQLDDMDWVRQGVTMFNDAFFWLCLIVGLLILAIVAILLLPPTDIAESVKSILRKLGRVFLVSGASCIVVALLMTYLVPNVVPVNSLASMLALATPGDVSVGWLVDLMEAVVTKDVMKDFFTHLFSPVLTAGIILASIGAGMLIASLFVSMFKKESKGDSSEEEMPEESAPEAPQETPAPAVSEPPKESTEESQEGISEEESEEEFDELFESLDEELEDETLEKSLDEEDDDILNKLVETSDDEEL